MAGFPFCYNTFVHPTFIIATLSILQTATESVSNRLVNADPSIALQRFAGYPTGARWGRFAFNPKFWAKGIDFSCVGPWNSAGGSQRAGTAISKRHIVFAKHFPFGKGVRVVFVGEDGGVCPARIEESKAVGDSGNPAFLLIGNERVLLYCLTSGGCGCGPLLHIRRKEIQKTMDELCPGYTLECFDFSKLKL